MLREISAADKKFATEGLALQFRGKFRGIQVKQVQVQSQVTILKPFQVMGENVNIGV